METIVALVTRACLTIALVPLAFEVLYLWILTIAATITRKAPPIAERERFFRVVIPAHDEELVLGQALQHLSRINYPSTKFDVIVIADNCVDRTGEIARAHGARVIERSDPVNSGKGHALAYAFATLGVELFDAYVIVDADTLVEPNLLAVLNRYLDTGHRVIQASYDVLNPFETPHTTLMYVALKIFHHVRPLGSNALGASNYLTGNGMCFARDVIDRYPWNAFSLTEDLEYSVRLLANGERIVLAPETTVSAQMPTTRTQATSQRTRWEVGRFAVARRMGANLVWRGLHGRNLALFDAGMHLVIPPLAALVLATFGGTALAALTGAVLRTSATMRLLQAWLALSAALACFVLTAMHVAGLPHQAYMALLTAPGYIAWKLALYVRMATRRTPQAWIRTERTAIVDE